MTYQIQSTFDSNFKIIYSNNVSSQLLDAEYADVPESHIDYKPSPSSSAVIYMFSVYFGRNTTNVNVTNIFAKLQYSDDNGENWTDWGDNTECYIGSTGSYLRVRTTVDIKFALNTAGWTNAKRLRLLMRRNTGNTSARLHQLESFYDENGEVSGTFHYNPSVSCVSID